GRSCGGLPFWIRKGPNDPAVAVASDRHGRVVLPPKWEVLTPCRGRILGGPPGRGGSTTGRPAGIRRQRDDALQGRIKSEAPTDRSSDGRRPREHRRGGGFRCRRA